MKLLKQLILITSISLFILSSCKKDSILTDSSAKIEFSSDSILFDTVFKYAGSATKSFLIYNRNARPIKISKIYLASGTSSAYRLNVDGVNATALNDVEILGKDSLFVFIQVSVTPNQNAPLLVKDSVVFETNGNIQDVKLTAIGQDVYLHKPNIFPTNGLPPYSILGTAGTTITLPNDKPHLFFGYSVIDSDCKLTIAAGTRLHFHNKAVLWVYDKGTLIVNGNMGNEVIFEGDRMEQDYKEVPGQWGQIWLSQGSKNNVIDWAIIKNGSIGIRIDSVATFGEPTLKLTNTIIKNMEAAALFAQDANIWSSNCLFTNCGQYTTLLIGGKYKFEQCTFANFWKNGQRNTPLLLLKNYHLVEEKNLYVIRNLDSAYFGNCILYGNLPEEIGMDSSIYGGVFSYKFENCIVKTERNTPNGKYYKDVIKNGNPDFKDAAKNDYRLNAGSSAIDKGYPNFISLDLRKQVRPNPSTSIPDLGAYEFYP
ncbi:MAG: choice-of-anchor Q domain-containing protein [Bacteroidia bacterium]